MAQQPPDQNFYHHAHSHPHAPPHPQLQLPPQFRNPFDLLFEERNNYNYIRPPYIPSQLPKQDDLSDSLVMRRPRRTRTTFTSTQIAELEQHFLQGRYLTSSRLAELSAKLALGTAQVKIWFKNRRRRHKIQSDQHRDHGAYYACDNMPLSPLMPTTKADAHVGNTSLAPPGLQALSMGCNGGGSVGSGVSGTTPSPTPAPPIASRKEMYGDAFHSYYYHNHAGMQQPATSHHALPSNGIGLGHQYPPASVAAAPAVGQFFPPHGAAYQHQQRHHHQHQVQPHQAQQQQHSSPSPYHGHHHASAVAVAAKNVVAAPATTQAPMTTAMTMATGVPDAPSAAMSPHLEAYEPLTPKNEECSSLCNGGNGGNAADTDVADDLDEFNVRSLQVLVPANVLANGGDDACGSAGSVFGRRGAGSGGGVGGGGGVSIGLNGSDDVASLMEDCGGAFAKFSKISTDYQCTMDTIMHAYSSHRNTPSSTQFAYCFN